MGFDIRKALPAEAALLAELRVEVLRAANGLPESEDMEHLRARSLEYYQTRLGDDSHIVYLAHSPSGPLAGCGDLCINQLLPTCDNPSGRKGTIMNMYVRPAHRRQGLASVLLEYLVREARARGCGQLMLEATAMGRAVYLRYGFVPMENEMFLPQLDAASI